MKYKCLLLLLLLSNHAFGQKAPEYEVQLDTVVKGYDGKTCWVHPRAGIIPGEKPVAVMTMMKLTVTGSDLFSPHSDLRSEDMGKTWSKPLERTKELGHRKEVNGVTYAICDFSPQWHAASGKLLAIGQTVRYQNNKVMEVRNRETAYSVYDAAKQVWADWSTVAMPDEVRFQSNGSGSAQRFDLPDGTMLIPIYFKPKDKKIYSVAVIHCAFDGKQITLKKVGKAIELNDGKRGLYEPSITYFGGKFFLTLRNDTAGYVATSTDGLNYGEPKKWCFDDGTELGNYNTQQHWVVHQDGLFLVYTRKGADNDHVFRHRAPLFMASVDPEKLHVIRSTEKVVVKERGARLGNFGVTHVNANETWITVAEWMQTWPPKTIIPVDNKYGADNSVYISRIRWKTPNEKLPTPAGK